jgi:hypothetical protein
MPTNRPGGLRQVQLLSRTGKTKIARNSFERLELALNWAARLRTHMLVCVGSALISNGSASHANGAFLTRLR